jgi:phosphoribosylamine--glycine ligase
MKILVIGSGGREHALAWKLRQSPRVSQVFCAPGNAGIAGVATCVPIPASDHRALATFARSEGIGLTVVGPDDALAGGVVDHFEEEGLRIFGPRQAAARLESSKSFAKDFMFRHGIPTADSRTFETSAAARAHCAEANYPLVVKADGLALGKGVVIATRYSEAEQAIREIMEERRFGEAGSRVVVEEFLQGEECSIHALVDGDSYLLFPAAQDHKRIHDGDQGPNTGGMGTFSPPSKLLSQEIEERIRTEVLERFLAGLRADGIDFRGMLFPGLMITASGPKVLEFNCRFGDPETQVLLTRLESDLLELLEATAERRLSKASAQWSPLSSVCVVLASAGYPGSPATGFPISGLNSVPADTLVFHAGTRMENGSPHTSGGRVLGVTALGDTLEVARRNAYGAVALIQFEGRQFRTDIAAKGL